MMKKEFKLSQLKMDENLLFIRKVNPVFVSKYRQNYREGADFPLMIVEQGSNRIISGNHRYTAMLQEFGPDYVITAITKKYDSEKEVLIDFANENSRHGNPIDGFTKKLLIQELLKNGVSLAEVSRIFNISIRRIEELGGGMINVIIGGDENKPETEPHPAKRGFEPPRPITPKEYHEHRNADRGLPLGQKVQELVRWLEGDLIIRNESNTANVKALKKACDFWLAAVQVEEPA